MKRLLLFQTIFLLALASCKKETGEISQVQKITFTLEQYDNLTRTSTPADEKGISDINIFLYNTRGKLTRYLYSNTPSERIQMEIPAGEHLSTYVIANAGNLTELPQVSDEASLKGECFTFHTPSQADGNAIPMSAYLPPRQFSDGESVALPLVRLLSKFRVIIDKSALAPTVTTFDIKCARLRNINTRVPYFSDGRVTQDNKAADIWESREGDDLSTLFTSGIDFYIPENMQGDLLNGNLDQKTHIPPEGYIQRCSYIEFLVNYRSTEMYDQELVYRYFIHDGRMLDNFDIIRNTMYTCITTFSGTGINEETWRIERSSLEKLVTSVNEVPITHTFTEIGEIKTFYAAVLPTDAHTNTVTWSSSDEKVAMVDRMGNVTAIGDGTCTITATANDISGVSGKGIVTVNSTIHPTSVSVSPASATIYTAEGISLNATVLPSGADNKSVIWSSSDNSIATVSPGGEVTGISAGQCTIFATTVDGGITSGSTITVKGRSFSIGDIPILYPGYNSPHTITYSAEPHGTPQYSIHRVSGEESLQISSGVLTASYHGSSPSGVVGSYILTGTLNGITREKEVKVDIGNIAISVPTTLAKGEHAQGRVTSLYPTQATVRWSSNNPSVATISSTGEITAIGSGTTTITARSSTGAYASTTLTVTEPYINISISGKRLLNSNIAGVSVAGFPTTLSLSVQTNATSPIEWTVTDSRGNRVPIDNIFNITSSGEITPINNASGRYTLRANSGGAYSNEVTLDVYMYLQYILSVYVHSLDVTKDEITLYYQFTSRWSDKSWSVLNQNPDWSYNFTGEPKYRIVKVDNEWGYSYISQESNLDWAISSVFEYYVPYDADTALGLHQHPETYLSSKTILRTLDDSSTRTGKTGIAIEDQEWGYFYIQQKP